MMVVTLLLQKFTTTLTDYHLKNIKGFVGNHIKMCFKCNEQKLHPLQYMQKYVPTVKGHHCNLTAIGQLTSYVVIVSFVIKLAESVATAFIHAVVCVFDAPTKLLLENRFKFFNSLFRNVF